MFRNYLMPLQLFQPILFKAMVLFCWTICLSVQAQTAVFTLDDALKADKIGAVAVSEKNRTVIFERIGPYETLIGRDAPYILSGPEREDIRSRIYGDSLDKSGEAGPLFEQHENKGYTLAGSNALSPDERFLGLYEFDGPLTRLGVFDFKEQKARFFDVTVQNAQGMAIFDWVSERDVIVSIRDRTVAGSYNPVEHHRKNAKTRELMWNDRGATVSVIGAGRYQSDTISLPLQKLIRVDVTTGEYEVVADKSVQRVELSPSGKYLAICVNDGADLINPQKNYSVGTLPYHRRYLEIANLVTGEVSAVAPVMQIGCELLEWAPDRDKLLTYMWRDQKSKEEGQYVVYDHVVGEIAALSIKPSFGTGRHKNSSDKGVVARGKWIGTTPVILGFNKKSQKNGWFALLENGEKKDLSKPFQSPPEVILATSDNAIFYLIDGSIWRVNLEGAPEHLRPTDGATYKAANVVTPQSKKNSLSSTPMRKRDEVGDLTVFLSDDGEIVSSIRTPDAAAKLRFVSKTAGIFELQTPGEANRLLYAAADETQGNNLLYAYNESMADIEVTSYPILIEHEGLGGKLLKSWLFLPPGATPEMGAFPTIVVPYAGEVFPDEASIMSKIDSIWDSNIASPISVQLLTARGYAVLKPSIALESAPTDPMPEIARTVMAAVDKAVAMGLSDPDRLAVSGHSYGGYSALSLAVQTDKFRAIISTAGLSNLISHYGQLDARFKYRPFNPYVPMIGWSELGQGRMGARPWRDKERYLRNSPLIHIDNVTSPVMLIHGDLDPLSITQSEEFYTALARQDKDAVFLRYWGESHNIFGNHNIRDMWERFLDFLEDNGVTPGPKTVH